MLFRGRSFSSSAFSLFIAFVMIFSTISWSTCLESRAAGTNVINDANKDNQITLDEVDPAQLVTYGLVTGYGVTGSDVTGSITSSSAYTTALSQASGIENTIVIGSVADGKLTFSEMFQNICANIYAEITGVDVIGYQIIPSYSEDYFIQWMNDSKDADVIYNNEYEEFYSSVMSTDYTGAFFYRNLDNHKGYIYLNVASSGYDFVRTSSSSNYRLSYIQNDGSITSNVYTSSYYYVIDSSFNLGTSGKVSYPKSGNLVLGCIGSPLVLFNSISDYTRFTNLTSQIYFSSRSSCNCNARGDSVATLNAYDWSALSSQVYTHVSSAVTDANVTTVSQVQSIIDSEMEDLTEFIEEKEDSGSGEGGSEGSGSNSDLSDKLEQGNQLQQESNDLQQENNELQKEENETSKGILGKLTDFFGSFFDNLINSVVGLFVPSSDELKALFDRLNQFFSDTFGFLYYPFDFLIQAFDIFLSSDSSTGLTFPGFSIMGYEVWADYTYDIASDPVAGTIFEYVRIGTGAILSIFFVGYLRAFFDKRFGGGGS